MGKADRIAAAADTDLSQCRLFTEIRNRERSRCQSHGAAILGVGPSAGEGRVEIHARNRQPAGCVADRRQRAERIHADVGKIAGEREFVRLHLCRNGTGRPRLPECQPSRQIAHPASIDMAIHPVTRGRRNEKRPELLQCGYLEAITPRRSCNRWRLAAELETGGTVCIESAPGNHKDFGQVDALLCTIGRTGGILIPATAAFSPTTVG